MVRSEIIVTILSRNRGHFLSDTIRSFLCQTLLPAQIIVLDNASDESTIAVVKSFAADGVIQEGEAELLRAIADTLDCPVPPFVQPQEADAQVLTADKTNVARFN